MSAPGGQGEAPRPIPGAPRSDAPVAGRPMEAGAAPLSFHNVMQGVTPQLMNGMANIASSPIGRAFSPGILPAAADVWRGIQNPQDKSSVTANLLGSFNQFKDQVGMGRLNKVDSPANANFFIYNGADGKAAFSRNTANGELPASQGKHSYYVMPGAEKHEAAGRTQIMNHLKAAEGSAPGLRSVEPTKPADAAAAKSVDAKQPSVKPNDATKPNETPKPNPINKPDAATKPEGGGAKPPQHEQNPAGGGDRQPNQGGGGQRVERPTPTPKPNDGGASAKKEVVPEGMVRASNVLADHIQPESMRSFVNSLADNPKWQALATSFKSIDDEVDKMEGLSDKEKADLKAKKKADAMKKFMDDPENKKEIEESLEKYAKKMETNKDKEGAAEVRKIKGALEKPENASDLAEMLSTKDPAKLAEKAEKVLGKDGMKAVGRLALHEAGAEAKVDWSKPIPADKGKQDAAQQAEYKKQVDLVKQLAGAVDKAGDPIPPAFIFKFKKP